MTSNLLIITILERDIKLRYSNGKESTEPFQLNKRVARFMPKIESAVRKGNTIDSTDLITLGEALYDSFFDNSIGHELSTLISQLKENDYISVFLKIEPPHFSAYPFEFLYHKDIEFLSRNQKLTLSRLLSLPQPYTPLQVQRPLRMLVIVCNPESVQVGRFKSDTHLEALKQALAIHLRRDNF